MTPVVHLFCVSDEVTQAVAALWEHPETDVEALHLAVALAYHGLLRAADQPRGIGREQLELAWELVRRVIVLANASPAWDELVGGFRADGMRFVCPFYMSSACISCSPSADRRYRASSTITQAE